MAPAPERLHFGWAMKGSQTSIWLSRIRRKSHIPGVYHFPHPPNILTLFVWCRYWVSSEKSGLRSRRMAASVCWAGIGMLYGTNASGLAWTSWQYNFTLFFFSPSPSLYVSLSLSISYSPSISITTTPAWRKRFGLGLNTQSCRLSHDCLLITMGPPWK